MTETIFSNYNYYKNHAFVKLMREYNKISMSEEDDEMRQEWGILLLADFYFESVRWLHQNEDEDYWKTGLE